MKKAILTSLLLSSFLSSFAQDLKQDLKYEVNAKLTNPIKKEMLTTAKVMDDIMPGYPTNWIKGYTSVEVSGVCNGKTITAKGKNEKLTKEQQAILNTADLGTNIVVKIEYKCENAITGATETSYMNYRTTYAPDIQAEYVSEQQTMTDYLKENIITKIPEAISKKMTHAIVKFIVNEEGKIDNAKISKTSGDLQTDNLLLEAINNMPKWKPAVNSEGSTVKQEFEFVLGSKYLVGC